MSEDFRGASSEFRRLCVKSKLYGFPSFSAQSDGHRYVDLVTLKFFSLNTSWGNIFTKFEDLVGNLKMT